VASGIDFRTGSGTVSVMADRFSPEPIGKRVFRRKRALDEKELEETMDELDTLFEEISGDSKK
jgi:hypothetical protein